ncbi:MAG: chemotaxis protein CheX [Leptospiraceae bacterium]|nr:chemotaxis protein CheX [Leptospiraceae bacterium]
MKSEYIQPFIKASQHALQHLCQIDIAAGSPALFETDRDFHDVSAIIGLAGEVTGAVALSFTTAGCLAASQAFTGIASSTVDDVAVDAIGELVNVIAGNAKEDLIQFKIYISLPNIVFGHHDLRFPRDTPAITVPMQSRQTEDFNLLVALKTPPQ